MTPERQQLLEETVKASPPAAIAGMSVFGISLPDWAAIASIIYIAVLLGEKWWVWHNKRKQLKRRGSDK